MKISVSAASRLTGKHRSTISKIASDLPGFPGPKGAWLYESRELLQRLYIGSDGAPTASEALRRLTLARTEQVQLQNDVMREKFYERTQVHFLWKHAFAIITQTIKGNVNRLLTVAVVNDIFAQVRQASADMLEQEDALWNAYEKEKEEKGQAANGSGERQGGEGNNRRRNAPGIPAPPLS